MVSIGTKVSSTCKNTALFVFMLSHIVGMHIKIIINN